MKATESAVVFASVFGWFQKAECYREETLVLGSEVLCIWELSANMVTQDQILKNSRCLRDIFFSSSNELALSPTESLDEHL